MSHVTAIKASIQKDDFPQLIEAAQDLGLEVRLDENGKPKSTWKWYGTWVDDYNREDAAYRQGIPTALYGRGADLVFGIKGDKNAYELAIIADEQGKYHLCYDFYGRGQAMRKVIGDSGKTLLQAFGVKKVMAKAQAAGFEMVGPPVVREDGKTVLALRPKQSALSGVKLI